MREIKAECNENLREREREREESERKLIRR